jgi:hypothetical protein
MFGTTPHTSTAFAARCSLLITAIPCLVLRFRDSADIALGPEHGSTGTTINLERWLVARDTGILLRMHLRIMMDTSCDYIIFMKGLDSICYGYPPNKKELRRPTIPHTRI